MDAASTVRNARARYFVKNDFGEDGGYDAAWVKLRVGPLRLWFPNTKGRVRAVRFHDIHHVLTGYDTTWVGEAEIGAWELASGCKHHLAAWILNGAAAAIGLVIAPDAVAAAWRSGRCCRNLYDQDWSDALLDETLGSLRRRLGIEG